MQKIIKIVRAVFEKNCFLTDQPTYHNTKPDLNWHWELTINYRSDSMGPAAVAGPKWPFLDPNSPAPLLIMQDMWDTTTKPYRLFRKIEIYNIKSSWCTILKKTAKKQIEPQAPLLVMPFLIIFSFWSTQKCLLQAFSPSLPTRYQGCPAN